MGKIKKKKSTLKLVDMYLQINIYIDNFDIIILEIKKRNCLLIPGIFNLRHILVIKYLN